MSKIIGIDYGAKRVGVAISDSTQLIATGLATIPSSSILIFLQQLVEKEEIGCIVIGDPRNLDGSFTDATVLVNTFIQKLAHHFPKIRLEKMDERFTSKIAKQAILVAGIKKMRRKF